MVAGEASVAAVPVLAAAALQPSSSGLAEVPGPGGSAVRGEITIQRQQGSEVGAALQAPQLPAQPLKGPELPLGWQ